MQPVERRILNYWLVEELGHDRLGRVFRAEEARADRTVVLRLLRVAGVAAADRVKVARETLRRRIRAAAAVVHPNVAAVLDFASHEDLEVLAVEEVPGESLAELAARGALLPLDDALWHASEIAAALEAAHARGVTHGRISPANIRLGRDGRARLLDLGIPRPAEVAYHMAGVADGDVFDTERRRDLHALGRTIQFMITGTEEASALRDARTLPGLGGAIVRSVTGVLQSHGADVARLRAALVDIARQTPADPHVAERPVRAAPRRRTPAIRRVVAVPPVSEPEPVLASAPATPVETAPPAPAPPVAEPVPVASDPVQGFAPPRAEAPPSARDMGLLVPAARPYRRSVGHRLAGSLRERRERWAMAFARLRSASTAQFAASAAGGAVLVLVALAVVQRPAADPAGDQVAVPAAELTVATTEAPPPPPAQPEPEPTSPARAVANGEGGAPDGDAPTVGSLRISVSPRGALVSLDGGPWRPAPVSFIELSAGVHVVRVRREGFEERSYSVTVRPGETTRRSFDLDGGPS